MPLGLGWPTGVGFREACFVRAILVMVQAEGQQRMRSEKQKQIVFEKRKSGVERKEGRESDVRSEK